MKRCLVLFFLFVALSAFSQKQMNHWFFATNNSLDFSSGAPQYRSAGNIVRMEGGSAISDRNGQLLFYSDGVDVWTRNHERMPNGFNLAGGYASSTQSCIIIPKTDDGKQYYIFTAEEEGDPRGLQYSIVDMTLNNGNGDVAVKNVPLVAPVSEKVTAIRHCNQKDYWIVTHHFGSNAFYAYHVTSTGVNPVPVISHTGLFIPDEWFTMAGALKASPDGKKLVCVNLSTGIDLLDFNNETGVISNATEIFGNENAAHYSAEFSASSKVLYVGVSGYWDATDVTRHSGVFQYDLSQPTIAGIINSKLEIARMGTLDELGTMQRGPDNRIYMSQYKKYYLSVIHSPEVIGMGCNFVNEAITLTNAGLFNLPNLANSYDFSLADNFTMSTTSCINEPITFNYTIPAGVNSVRWDFDDPGSGSQNSSTNPGAIHLFTKAGDYTIRLIKYTNCGVDTLKRQLSIKDIVVDLGQDSSFCEGETLTLDPNTPGTNSYLWSNGSTLPTINISAAGEYWVRVTRNDDGCSKADTIVLESKSAPIVHLGADAGLCDNETMLLDGGSSGTHYRWQDNSSQQSFLVNQPGKYWVEVTAVNGCQFSDTITLNASFKPQFSLGADQYMCPGTLIELHPVFPGGNYLWQDGSNLTMYSVTIPGIYYVDISNRCGTTRDSISITTGSCKIYIPTAFTPGNDGLNDYFRVSGTNAITDFEMRIYNRWGEVVYASKNKSDGWDGAYKGTALPEGVYVYAVRFKEINDTGWKTRKGTVTLIR